RARAQVKLEDEVTALPTAKAPTIEEALARGELILLAEDNPTNQDVTRRQLASLGYACEIAEDGAEALEAYKRRNYALLLTDCHMPVMDGYELARQIRVLEQGQSRRLPIIAVTASALQREAHNCFAAGMD